MPDRSDQRAAIAETLSQFGPQPLPEAAKALFATLGYESNRTLPVTTPKQFCKQLDPGGKLTKRERESLDELQSLSLLFQLTDAEFTDQRSLLDDGTSVETTQIHS